MENRGRKAVDVVVINTQHLRLKPPEYLNKHEAAIWSEVVNATDPQHFKRCEAPLLATYCTAAALARFYSARIGVDGDQGSNHKQLD